jgi:hypothetical protein
MRRTSGSVSGIDDTTATKSVRIGARSATETRQIANGTTSIPLNQWSRLGAVVNYAGDFIQPYVNGAAEGGGAVAFTNTAFTLATPATADSLGGFGAPPAATPAQWDGLIAEVAIWTSDIGAAGFAQLEKVSARLVSPATLVYYSALRGKGATEVDTISSLVGTITGSIPTADGPGVTEPAGPLYTRRTTVSTAPFAVTLQAEFSGRGNGWTDVSADLADQSIKLRYGVNGNKPRDRVAASGTLDFALNNSSSNSGGVVGYYSPGHASRRSGWKLGVRVRFSSSPAA